MEKMLGQWVKTIFALFEDDNFLHLLHRAERLISKFLATCLIIVIFVSLFDLAKVLLVELWVEPFGFFNKTLLEVFGLFLNILIALELLENIAAYLKKNVIQVELVVVTAIIAVSRKIIIFDFKTYQSLELFALGFAIICLSVSFWLLKQLNKSVD